MNLKAKLARLQTQSGAVDAAPPNPVAQLRERIAQLERGRHGHARARTAPPRAPVADHAAMAAAVGGEYLADGLIAIHKRIPLSGELGSIPLDSLCGSPPLPGETGNDTLRFVYIDTETTGLSGGSGTLAFLVGIAVVSDTAVELTQFLLTGFGAEPAMLTAFADCLGDNDRLVSYNGKSYDLPLLLTRFRMQGLAPAFTRLPHLDLLHPVRRLFSRRWDDCRLPTLERKLLGFSRVDDLPGSEAPAAWFSYIRFGQGGQLARVVAHNQQDILSLAVAHSVLGHAVARPTAFGVDIHTLTRWLAESDEDEARELLEMHAGALCDDGKRFLGHLARRAGNWRQAVEIWESLAAGGCADSVERLAKYHEHISRNLAAAKRYCEDLPVGPSSEQRRRRVMQKMAQTPLRRTRC